MKNWTYIAVALAAALAGFGMYRWAVAPRLAQQAYPAASETSTATSAPAEASQTPEMLPDFTLADLQGEQRSILSWPGKSMIVNFWATWCAPCRREIPLLKKVHEQHGGEGFQLVGVAVDFREDVLKFAQELGVDYPILIGEQDGLEAISKFGQGSIGIPFTVFTDNQHRIVALHLGELDAPGMDILLGLVRRVNAGELSPAAARIVAAKQLSKLPHARA
ncbi:MAG TPA: TlpA disulfide reductase family protein [Steroidobacter sp.]|jgi:thiol-disulfide isomerase/thioredoxin|nr:TlpA disulfide reductase family protein [Steroidobacter sp.]